MKRGIPVLSNGMVKEMMPWSLKTTGGLKPYSAIPHTLMAVTLICKLSQNNSDVMVFTQNIQNGNNDPPRNWNKFGLCYAVVIIFYLKPPITLCPLFFSHLFILIFNGLGGIYKTGESYVAD